MYKQVLDIQVEGSCKTILLPSFLRSRSTQFRAWMKELVQISHISAIHTLHSLLSLMNRLRAHVFFEEPQQNRDFCRAQLFVVQNLIARTKTTVHSIARKMYVARW